MCTKQEEVDRLLEMRRQAQLGGGEERLAQQHERGKLSARERLDLLLDPDSFVEFDAFVTHRATDFGLDRQRHLGDGVVTGHGTIDGRIVVDANNYYPQRDGQVAELDADETTSSELVARHLPGARVVKAFNTIYFENLGADGRPNHVVDIE